MQLEGLPHNQTTTITVARRKFWNASSQNTSAAGKWSLNWPSRKIHCA